jgi:hypothetical protein
MRSALDRFHEAMLHRYCPLTKGSHEDPGTRRGGEPER